MINYFMNVEQPNVIIFKNNKPLKVIPSIKLRFSLSFKELSLYKKANSFMCNLMQSSHLPTAYQQNQKVSIFSFSSLSLSLFSFYFFLFCWNPHTQNHWLCAYLQHKRSTSILLISIIFVSSYHQFALDEMRDGMRCRKKERKTKKKNWVKTFRLND